jgi:hypothetical protein
VMTYGKATELLHRSWQEAMKFRVVSTEV